jgi:hypothetical protein
MAENLNATLGTINASALCDKTTGRQWWAEIVKRGALRNCSTFNGASYKVGEIWYVTFKIWNHDCGKLFLSMQL